MKSFLKIVLYYEDVKLMEAFLIYFNNLKWLFFTYYFEGSYNIYLRNLIDKPVVIKARPSSVVAMSSEPVPSNIFEQS